MAVARLREMLDEARWAGYAVPAFNVSDELSMDAVLMSAAQLRSPVIVQVSVRTARFWGPRVLQAGFAAKAHKYGARAVLHLDHCREPRFLVHCLDDGWDSGLFDASHLPYAEGVRATRQVVCLARRRGAAIEGEFEPITRVGSGPPSGGQPVASIGECVRFVQSTGVSCFSPALGTQHGVHGMDPDIDYARAYRLSQVVPVVLHGGSGLSEACLSKVVSSGVCKINFSSVLKAEYAARVQSAVAASLSDPLELVSEIHGGLGGVCRRYMELADSAGRAA